MNNVAANRAAGWLSDPAARGYELRYWDGSVWTEHVSKAGETSTDPDGITAAKWNEFPTSPPAPVASPAPPPAVAAVQPAAVPNVDYDNTLWIPKAVARVSDNFGPITDAYIEARTEQDPYASMLSALEIVLPSDGYPEVHAFFRGEGERFEDGEESPADNLVEKLEEMYVMEVIFSEAPEGRDTPKPTHDIADLAEWLAGDPNAAYTYRRGLAEFPTLARARLDDAVADILAIADSARTKTGRKVKIEQAERVFSLMGKKALRYDGEEATSQAVWCDALAATLKPLRK